jgi:hypothetical protein
MTKDNLKAALEIAAQIWCDPRCSDSVMDPNLCRVFAERLKPYLDLAEAANDEWENGEYGVSKKLELALRALEAARSAE